jgi:hypothetical protein
LLIVVVIAALVAVIILCYTHVAIFRAAINDLGKAAVSVFNGILGVVSAVYNWIAQNWPLLVAILTGPFGLAAYFIMQNWSSLVAFFRGIPNDIAGIAAHMWDSMVGAFKTTLNAIIDLWNSMKFTLPTVNVGPVHLGGETIGVPQIPHLAQGGLITQTGLVLAHAGEAITPLPGRLGPAVQIDHASFSTELDVETFMRRAAWVAQTAKL